MFLKYIFFKKSVDKKNYFSYFCENLLLTIIIKKIAIWKT